MSKLTRRDVLRGSVGAGSLVVCGGVEARDPAASPLADAVIRFNRQAAEHPIGSRQPALTRDEVVAALRWRLLDDSTPLPVTDVTRTALRDVAEERALPPGFEFEVLDGYEPDDQVTFDVWSVRLRVPSNTVGTHAIVIRETWIGSRRIGPEERAVIRAWAAREQPGSFERVEWMRRYREDRARAAERDAQS